MTEPLHLSIDAQGVLWHGDTPVPPGAALLHLLTRAREHEPPPRIALDVGQATGYETVGRVIYMAHRVGFLSEQLDIIGQPGG
jgi:biopolymer transport protein ExbD